MTVRAFDPDMFQVELTAAEGGLDQVGA